MLIGITSPTSIGGSIQPLFAVSVAIFMLPFLSYLLLKQKKVDPINLFIALGVGISLTLFTFLSDYPTYRYGNGLMFINLFLLSLINNNKNPNDLSTYLKTLVIANTYLFILSICIIFGIPFGIDLISSSYQAFYIELIPNMLAQSKPVTVFGTHSLAGFYDFLFFIVNIAVYKYTRQTKFMMFAIGYMLFLFWLQSSTSLVNFFLAFIIIQAELYRTKKHLFYIIFAAELIAAVLTYQLAGDLIDQTLGQLFSERNGLGGRYSEGGNLVNNLQYVMDHPFKGIGFGYTTEFFYADSGYLEYALRDGILGALGIFIAFSRYILRNVKTSYRYLLLFAYLSFEVGFSNLLYFRTFPITLFSIALFNQMQGMQKVTEKTEREHNPSLKSQEHNSLPAN